MEKLTFGDWGNLIMLVEVYWRNSSRRGRSKLLASGGIHRIRKTLLRYFTVGTCNIGKFTFDTYLETGKEVRLKPRSYAIEQTENAT